MKKKAADARSRVRRMFQKLEQEWEEAILRKDLPSLERFLDKDYALRVAHAPERRTTRDAWLRVIPIYNTHSFKIRSLQVRNFGDLVVVSHILKQDADMDGVDRSGDFFLIDVWRRHKKGWKVCARYSSFRHKGSA